MTRNWLNRGTATFDPHWQTISDPADEVSTGIRLLQGQVKE
jgi:hypothetical protein